MTSKKILLVEDEIDIREALAEALLEAGFEVITAENGQVGLELALTEHPDLILLDIIMPILDGHGLLKALRQNTWGRDVKVIMLTSMDDVQNIATAHENNLTDYVIKAHSSLEEIVKRVKLTVYSS